MPDAAVQQILESARLLLIEDFLRIEEKKRTAGSQTAAIIGKENSQYSRGMIYAFLTPDEVPHYMPTFKVIVRPDREFVGLDDPDFHQFLSSHLSADSDRARSVTRRDDGRHYLYADSNIESVWEHARSPLEDLLGDITVTDQDALAFNYGDESRARKADLDGVYRRLFADAYHGHEAKRTGTGLYLAMATGRQTIITRQRVVEQDEFDITVTDASGEVVRSRLGTGEILLIGPKGLEQKTVLRIAPGASAEFHLGHVERWDPDLSSRPPDDMVERLPVIMEMRSYVFQDDRVRPISETPAYIPASALPLHRLPQSL